MSRLFRFLLLLAGAGALVAVVRHMSRRTREPPQPFFADAHRAPAPARARGGRRRRRPGAVVGRSPSPTRPR